MGEEEPPEGFITLEQALATLTLTMKSIEPNLKAEHLDSAEALIKESRELLKLLRKHILAHEFENSSDPAEAGLEGAFDSLETEVLLHESTLHCFRGEYEQARVAPWAALELKGRGRMVDQDWTFSLLQSALDSHDILRRRQQVPSSGIGVFAPDSDVNENRGGQLDIDAIKSVRPEASLFLEKNATLDLLASYAQTAAWIHLRTHGRRAENLEYYPVLNGLRWDDDSLIQSSHSCLVVAACGTGSTSESGLEISGFASLVERSEFRALVAPVYPVDGVTTGHWITSFYKNLGDGMNLAEACQAASRSTRDKFVHPCFWAPMICVGDYGATLPGKE